MDKYPEASYVYIGDNPKKDFVGANEVGWNTICLLDNGENVHKQEFDILEDRYLPDVRIKSLVELVEII